MAKENKMYKIEPHLHTCESSPCGVLHAREMVKRYSEAGYNTVIITDHLTRGLMDAIGDELSWKEKVTVFLSGYFRAKKAAEAYGINVLMAAEFQLDESLNHYLAYGITREFLEENPDIFSLSIKDFYTLAKANGIFIVQAHPYRDKKCFPTPEYVDGFEIFNSNARHIDYSDKSENTAKEYGLYVSAGSDAHRIEDVGLSGLISETEIKTMEDFVALIKSRKAEIIKYIDNDVSFD